MRERERDRERETERERQRERGLTLLSVEGRLAADLATDVIYFLDLLFIHILVFLLVPATFVLLSFRFRHGGATLAALSK